MEVTLRAALIARLQADAGLASALNAITEEAPSRASLPWLAIAASASNRLELQDRARPRSPRRTRTSMPRRSAR